MPADPPDPAALARLLAELPTTYRWEGGPSGVTNWPPGPQPDVLIEFQGLSNNEAYACLLAEAANALPVLLAESTAVGHELRHLAERVDVLERERDAARLECAQLEGRLAVAAAALARAAAYRAAERETAVAHAAWDASWHGDLADPVAVARVDAARARHVAAVVAEVRARTALDDALAARPAGEIIADDDHDLSTPDCAGPGKHCRGWREGQHACCGCGQAPGAAAAVSCGLEPGNLAATTLPLAGALAEDDRGPAPTDAAPRLDAAAERAACAALCDAMAADAERHARRPGALEDADAHAATVARALAARIRARG